MYTRYAEDQQDVKAREGLWLKSAVAHFGIVYGADSTASRRRLDFALEHGQSAVFGGWQRRLDHKHVFVLYLRRFCTARLSSCNHEWSCESGQGDDSQWSGGKLWTKE